MTVNKSESEPVLVQHGKNQATGWDCNLVASGRTFQALVWKSAQKTHEINKRRQVCVKVRTGGDRVRFVCVCVYLCVYF